MQPFPETQALFELSVGFREKGLGRARQSGRLRQWAGSWFFPARDSDSSFLRIGEGARTGYGAGRFGGG